MQGTERSSHIALLADCQSLQVGELWIAAGSTESFDAFDGAAALIFTGGEGRAIISGCAHSLEEGSVELVCPGESCAMAAVRDIHAYVVITKERQLSSGDA